MLSYYLITGFLLGLLGSFHCIGMCAPIALALPVVGKHRWQRVLGLMLYHLGRISTYAFLGVLVGSIGYGASLSGWQQVFSVIIGVFILTMLLLPAGLKHRLGLAQAVAPVRNAMAKLWANASLGTLWFIGLLNGLLPCGLVYAALAGSLTTFSLSLGAAYMVAFGVGTLPMLLAAQWIGRRISVNFRARIKRAIPVLVGCMAILLILRGLNLGIPYLSPALPIAANGAVHCG